MLPKITKARYENEKPYTEVVQGSGVTFRNQNDFVEVVCFIGENEDVETKAA
jgi:hypothetical protein